MNFLGHCFLCESNEHLIAGNLAGDSYKGNTDKFLYLPKNVYNGILLHRFIDDFTDKSHYIQEVAAIMYSNKVERIAYIACDILLDHYLSKKWTEHSETPYSDFIQKIYTNVDAQLQNLEDDFKFLYDRMKTYRWLEQYPHEEGIRIILQQFSKRIPFQNNLDQAIEVYLQNKKTIEINFKTFLLEIKFATNQFILANKMNNL